MNKRFFVWVVALCSGWFAARSDAQEIVKADNTLPLNDPASWTGGVVPGDSNIAVWDSTVLGANTVTLGGALTWDGLRLANPGGTVTLQGADRLTLDGGAATDLDLSLATQDLVLDLPVTLGGSQAADIAAGRSITVNGAASIGGLTKKGDGLLHLTGTATCGNGRYEAGLTVFDGTTTLTGDHSLAGGTALFRGPVAMSQGNIETLGIYNGTLVLDGAGLTMTNGSSRFFAGRTHTTSDGLLIVSNGTHSILGYNSGSMANFIGVSGARRGRLHLENGSLSVVYLRLGANQKGSEEIDELIVNNGLLSVTGSTGTDPVSKAFKMGTRFDESTTEAATRSSLLAVNGGRFEVPNGTSQVATDVASSTGSQQILLNGGTWAVKKLAFGSSPTVTRTLAFDGGTLEGTNVLAGSDLIEGAAYVTATVRAGGARLASAPGNDFSVTLNLAEDPASPGGGLVKLGNGRLTLGGANTYTGPTVVSNGVLALSGTLAVTNLTVAPGASFSLADGTLSTFAPAALRFGVGGAPAVLELEVAPAGNACDALHLPNGAWIQNMGIALVQQGTRQHILREGDFPILTYAGTAPAIAGLSWANPVIGFTCAFTLDSVTRTVTAQVRLDPTATPSVWVNPSHGDWTTAANWNALPASAAGTAVLFGAIPTAATAVTLDTPFTLGSAAFDNPYGYTLSGAGTLTLDNAGADAALTVVQGEHTVNLPLALPAPLTVTPDAGTALTLAAPLSGSGGLNKQGNGVLKLTADNSYAGGTHFSRGELWLSAGASLGTGPITHALANGRLRSVGAEPVVITNDLLIAASGAALDADGPMIFSGRLDWATGQKVFQKFGHGTLIFTGQAEESGNYQINHRTATLRVAEGARIVITNANARDTIYLSAGTSEPRTFTVETGAVVVAGGIYTGSGPSNTVHVNGGSLTLTGSGGSGESGLIRTVTDVAGADRIIVDAGDLTFSEDDWLSTGVRGGGAEIIVNGGTATFGRLSLGVRGDTSFASSGLPTYANIFVNGGVMTVSGVLNWLADVTWGRTNRLFLNGGTLRLPPTFRSVSLSVGSGSAFTLNGGTLEVMPHANWGSLSLNNYLSGLTDLFIDQGGGVIDTCGHDTVITQQVQRVGATTGGLTKRGAGTLTLSGPCDYIGTTAVEAGSLRFTAPVATGGLTLSAGTALSLRNGTYDALTLAAALFADGARLDLDVSADSAACDQLALPEGATLGDLVIGLYTLGSDTPVARAETYPLFTYTGTPPDISGLTLAPECFGVACTFAVNTGTQTIDAQLAYTDTQVSWANAAGGDWSLAGNWTPLPPAAAGAVTRFGSALTADATVNVDSPVSVAGMLFDHTYRYTLDGAAVTFAPAAGDASLTVARGAHTLAGPLTLNAGTLAAIAPDAALTVADQISGAGSLTVDGGGLLALDGTNTTPLTVRGAATVQVPTVDSLGAVGVTLDGGSLRVSASDTLGGTVLLGAAGGAFSSGTGQTLQLEAAVSGSGSLIKNGHGTVTLGAAAGGYTGATVADGGTLSLAALPPGEWVLGRGTLAYTGAAASSAQPVTIDSGTNAAVLHTASDLTLSGGLATLSGALLKNGAGALTLAGPTTNTLGLTGAANPNGLASSGVDGDGPAAGFGAFNIAQGRVTLGSADQLTTIGGPLFVGLATTAAADSETAGELAVTAGETVCSDWTHIGRNNGSAVTAPAGLAARLLLQGGTFTTRNLALGTVAGLAGYTGRPVLEIQDGTCTVQDLFYVGEGAGGISTVWVSGGTLRHEVLFSDTSCRLGNGGGEGILRMTGGRAEFAKDIILAMDAGCTGTVELAGGTLSCYNLYAWTSPDTGYSRVLFNGGVFQPTGTSLNNAFDEVKIGAAPAIIDTTLAQDGLFTLSAVLTGADTSDGGLVKAGTGTLAVTSAQAYTGPTVVSAGVLRVQGSLPAASALMIAPGARLHLNQSAAQTVTASALTLGDALDTTPAELVFGIDTPNATNDQIAVSGDVTAHHAVFHLFWQSSATENIVANGRYALLRWSGSGPSTVDAFSVANPQPGKAYVFSVEDNTLWLEIDGASSGAHVWTAADGGTWSDAGKWAFAPGAGAPGATVRFDDSLAADASVLLDQNATAGLLFFNSTNAYTLSGNGVNALSLDNGGATPGAIQIEQGRHTLSAPVALLGETDIKPIAGTALSLNAPVGGIGSLVKRNAGELILGAANTFTGGLRLVSGTLTLTNGANAGTGPLSLENDYAPLRVAGTGPSELGGPLSVRVAQPVVEVAPQAGAVLAGGLAYEHAGAATLIKRGEGELVLAGVTEAATDNARVSMEEGQVRFAAGSVSRIGDVDRQTFRMDTNNDRSRTLAVDAGAQVTLAGLYMANGTNAVVVDGQLAFSGNNDAVCLRIQGSTVEDRVTVRTGGVLSCLPGAWFNIGVRGPGALSIEGGTAQLGSVSLGYQQRPEYYGGAYGRVFVTGGGMLDVTGRWNWMGESNNLGRVNSVFVGDGSPAGATLRLPPTVQTRADGWSTLALNGGTLVTTGQGLGTPVGGNYLYGLKQFYVGPAGGTFDTAGQAIALALPVGADAPGGTFAKAGTGTLALTEPLRWDGLIDVQGGVLNAALGTASVRQTEVPDLLARYSMENGSLYDSSGNGRHAVQRGALDYVAGTNGLTGVRFATGISSVCTPLDAECRGLSSFTVALWLWVNNVTTSANTPTTFFTTRATNGTNGPYEMMLRMNANKVRIMSTGNTTSWTSVDTTGAVPGPNQWFHVAYVITPAGVTAYINGQPAGTSTAAAMKTTLLTPPDRPLGDFGFGFGHYHLATPQSGQFTGRLDDVRVYGRALSQAEVQQVIDTADALPDLRVAGGATLAAQGATNTVRTLSGEGYVSGALTVLDRVSAGDDAGTPAGATLMAEQVTLAPGAVYAWSWSPSAHDMLLTGDLVIGGAGTLDLGRSEGDLINGSFRAVLMTYDTLIGAEHLSGWTLVNAGGKGYNAVIKAENGEVVLEYESTRGTLMWLK
ncbi:MAG: autotransporter-associated beta strand repeat-containing protein [Kiritimatiellae bacterium]|nr:autotransporter-associated beta strand repeat-containing protein [Kiritimatiellia bacterium]